MSVLEKAREANGDSVVRRQIDEQHDLLTDAAATRHVGSGLAHTGERHRVCRTNVLSPTPLVLANPAPSTTIR